MTEILIMVVTVIVAPLFAILHMHGKRVNLLLMILKAELRSLNFDEELRYNNSMKYIITTEQSVSGYGNINYNLLKITSNKEVAERFAQKHNDKVDKSSGTYPKPVKCKIQEWDGKSQITLFERRY